MFQGQLRGAMTQRQRDQTVVALDIQVKFQLFTPRASVAHQGATGGTGAPLTSYQKILNFIRTTNTRAGLEVSAYLDRRCYPTGVSPLRHEIEQLHLKPASKLPNWNYTIAPNL